MLAAYLAGGFPTGVIVSRYLLGKDVRDFGSHNPGAVNVWRVFGLWWGFLVVFFDIGKGYLATAYLPVIAGNAAWSGFPALLGFLAVAGHIWSPYTGYRGGKGVGTIAGVALALHPSLALWAISIWCIVALTTRYSSLASLTASTAFPLLVWWKGDATLTELVTLFFIPIIVVLTHRTNISRLLAGRELKIGKSQPYGG